MNVSSVTQVSRTDLHPFLIFYTGPTVPTHFLIAPTPTKKRSLYLNSLVNHFICCWCSCELTSAFRGGSTWRRAIHADRARKYANPCKRSREKTRSGPDRREGESLCLASLPQGCPKRSCKTTRARMVLVFLEEQGWWYLEAHPDQKSTEDTRWDGP
jgi:hypothetical protein